MRLSSVQSVEQGSPSQQDCGSELKLEGNAIRSRRVNNTRTATELQLHSETSVPLLDLQQVQLSLVRSVDAECQW